MPEPALGHLPRTTRSEKPEVGEHASAWTFAQATRYDSSRDDHYKSRMESRGWRLVEGPVKGD